MFDAGGASKTSVLSGLRTTTPTASWLLEEEAMRKWIVMFLATLAMALSVVPVLAEDETAPAADPDKKFVVTGQLRVRWERLENYFDFDNDSDDAFSFFPYRARVGVAGQLANDVQVSLEIQNFGSFGDQNPQQSFFFPPFQNFDGDGNTNGVRSSETSIYQAYVNLNKIGGSGFGARLGRQEYEIGDGLILGNEDYYNGTVFDGVRGWYDFGGWQINGFYFVTTERNDLSGSAFTGLGADDQHMEGVVVSFHPVAGGSPTNLDGYLINWEDGAEFTGSPNFWTLGAHWSRTVATIEDADEFGFDWNAEVAMQSGEATDFSTDEQIDIGGSIINLGLGYNLVSGDMIHRFHGNIISQSGDDDVTDSDAEGWNILYPRTHGRFGEVDFFGSNFGGYNSLFLYPPTGITALSGGYELNIGDGKHLFAATAWWFMPTEDSIEGLDLDDDGDDDSISDLGSELDLSYSYKYSRNVWLTAALGYLMPGDGLTFNDVTGDNASDDPITRVSLGATVRF